MLILKPLSIDRSVAGANIPAVTFIAQAGLPARELAHMLDSLVRVSRRVEENHLVIVCGSGKRTAHSGHPEDYSHLDRHQGHEALQPDTSETVHE